MTYALGEIANLSERERELVLIWIRIYDRRVFDMAVNYVESQTKPPRIPEPGMWGVVTDGQGRIYVREAQEERWRWNPLGHSQNVAWDEIESPTLVRDGVES